MGVEVHQLENMISYYLHINAPCITHLHPARPHEAAPAAMRRAAGRMPHHTHATHCTPIHTPITQANKRTHECAAAALSLHMRRPFMQSLGPSHAHLSPARRSSRSLASRCRTPPLAASPPRCCDRRWRRRRCRRGRRCCRATCLAAYHCRCHRQGTCESRTGDSKRALGVVRRADSRPTTCHREARATG